MCRAGASWVQTHILEHYRGAKLRVYVIWTVKLTFDSRDQWDGGGLIDPRVIHLWDQQDVVGGWSAVLSFAVRFSAGAWLPLLPGGDERPGGTEPDKRALARQCPCPLVCA